MNASPLIIKGLEENMRTSAPMIGAGVIGSADFQSTQQFCGDHVGTQRVVATMIGGEFSVYHCIMHGCRPMDGIYHTITDMDGAILRAPDDKAIATVINELYGNEEWQQKRPLRRLAVGVSHGEKYGTFAEDAYLHRLIMGVLPDRRGQRPPSCNATIESDGNTPFLAYTSTVAADQRLCRTR